MSGSLDLLRAWVGETLGSLADDDDHNARLRDTLRVFLQENGSYKSTAERLVLHKNTVQYRVRKAEESMRRPLVQDRLRTELALLATQWLGPAVRRPALGRCRKPAFRAGPRRPGPRCCSSPGGPR
jgi:DNA-binding PucR family transcriptional regulator